MFVRPQECVVAVGIPTCRSEYLESLDRIEEKSVIQIQQVSWPKYEREITRPFIKAYRRWTRLGVVVFTKVTLSTLSKIFLRSDLKVLVLISHSHGDQLELSEGMVRTDDVLELIPESFSGTIDLCVCHSQALAMKIKQQRRSVIVKFSDNPAMYTTWFGVYVITFTLLAKRNFKHYVEALDSALDKITDRR